METATLAEDGDPIISQKMGDAMGIFHGDTFKSFHSCFTHEKEGIVPQHTFFV